MRFRERKVTKRKLRDQESNHMIQAGTTPKRKIPKEKGDFPL